MQQIRKVNHRLTQVKSFSKDKVQSVEELLEGSNLELFLLAG